MIKEATFSYRQMRLSDIFRINGVNLDSFTETYNINYYGDYLATWPELCFVCEAPDQSIVGYLISKVEGEGQQWHGHVTALSVSQQYRSQGIATMLMKFLEEISTKLNCNFIDLFVRPSNEKAVKFYKQLGYFVYQTIPAYYTDEDGFDMRKMINDEQLLGFNMETSSIYEIIDKLENNDTYWGYDDLFEKSEVTIPVKSTNKSKICTTSRIDPVKNSKIITKSSRAFQIIQANEKRINSILESLGTDTKHLHMLAKQRQFTNKPQGRKQLFYTPEKQYSTPDLWLTKSDSIYNSYSSNAKEIVENTLDYYPNIGREWYIRRWNQIKSIKVQKGV
ncbi:N-alpha-acetyltransferase 20 [Cryptosporidium felis]|nr:N-alpha-acetyltransferase 20 [Cryptosporidium felis]